MNELTISDVGYEDSEASHPITAYWCHGCLLRRVKLIDVVVVALTLALQYTNFETIFAQDVCFSD